MLDDEEVQEGEKKGHEEDDEVEEMENKENGLVLAKTDVCGG